LSLVPGMHLPSLLQQPLGQEVASQMHAPPEQRRPSAQAAAPPQEQVPFAPSQPSAVSGSHGAQALPAVPHAERVVGTTQVPLEEQQPAGHDWALHTQAPPEQAVPAGHIAPAPQRHSPVAPQLLARAGSHGTHAAPPDPQAVGPGIAHVDPEQQPPAQLPALQSLHAPPAQTRAPQPWQAAPPLPQLSWSVPGRQAVPAQHPWGHDVGSQTQAPFAHRCPAAHGGPDPHWQTPDVEQTSLLPLGQVRQARPPVPQVGTDRGWQVVPEQQPLGHEKASQTHAPPAQRWPVAQAGPAPHAQAPAGVQLSAIAGSQGWQAAPDAPHRASAIADTQVEPSQQPLGHDVASQAQRPPVQCCPATQVGPPPQPHAPPGEQPSARVASQPTHTAPPLPQAGSDGGLHVAPEQQPPGQLVALHPLQRPAAQVWPAGQVSQALPPAPHDIGLSPATHVPAAQQPPGHDVPSHTQVLARQRWPGAQAAPLPQRQAPAAEQLSDRASHDAQVAPAFPQVETDRATHTEPWQQPLGQETASHTHSPPAQRCPPAHAGPAPHAHAPVALQWSALLPSQGTQLAPLTPQAASAGDGWHTFPAQQPDAHDVASHTHAPPTQRWPLSQGAAAPQRQAPAIEQVSALSASQPTHAIPPRPHAASDRG
jgi:hypothetical protein